MERERVRLFVAAELPAEVARDLAGWANDVMGSDPAIRLLDPSTLHVTLAFLGPRDLGEVDPLAAALTAEPWPGEIAFDDVLWLPRRRPSVCAVGFEDPMGGLVALQAAVVERVAGAVAWEPEARPFLPHVTVGRVRAGARPRTLELTLPPPGTFPLEAVTLMRSHLGAGGARYEALASVRP